MTCSKRILVVSYICGVILTIVTIVGCFLGYDISVIGTITGIAYGEISLSNAFYYNKAKRENAIKIALDCVRQMPDKFDGSTDIVSLLSAISNS